MKLIGTLLEAGSNFNNFTNKSKKPCTNFITLDIVELQKKWPAIVGKGILLNHTIPYKLLNGELHIVTNYRPLLNESYYMGKILKKKLEKENKNKKFITGTIFVFQEALPIHPYVLKAYPQILLGFISIISNYAQNAL